MSIIVQTATGPQEITIQTQPGPQVGWGRGRDIYMLATDEANRVVPLPGTNHRRVYVSGNGLTEADIAVAEGVSVGTVTGAWLRDNHPEYGESEALALHPSIGFALWDAIPKQNSSHWLLYERGYTYTTARGPGGDGESPLHPILIGAWGEGAKPVVSGVPGMGDRQNVVIQGIEIGALTVTNPSNVIIDDLATTGMLYFTDWQATAPLEGITIRNTTIADTDDNGILLGGIDGVLLEGVFISNIGTPGGQSRHSTYIGSTVLDVTIRDSFALTSPTQNGFMARGGAFMQNVIAADIWSATHYFGEDQSGPAANYSLGLDLLSTAARHNDSQAAMNQTVLASFVDVIFAHANNPDDSSDTSIGNWARLGTFFSRDYQPGPPFWDNLTRWNWGGGREPGLSEGVDGLDPAVMNATTIWNYAASLPDGQPTLASLDGYFRGLEGTQIAEAVQALNNYHREGFGLDLLWQRADPTTLQFIPDFRGEGTRWDNRLNWQLANGDRADGMPLNGDTLNLRGCIVRTYQTWTGTLNLQGGTLIVSGGKIDGSVVGPGTVRLEKAGRLGATISGGATVDDQRAGLAASVVEWA